MKIVLKNRTEWREELTGSLHRLDGPAREWDDGTRHWLIDGKFHRLDGPAIEEANGTRHWYINGKLNRLDGPAIEAANGIKYWYINGVFLSELQWFNTLPLKSQITYLFKMER